MCGDSVQIDTKIPHQHTRLLGKPLTVSRGIKCPLGTVGLTSIGLTSPVRTFLRELEFSTDSCSAEGLLVAVRCCHAVCCAERGSCLTGVLCWGWFRETARGGQFDQCTFCEIICVLVVVKRWEFLLWFNCISLSSEL